MRTQKQKEADRRYYINHREEAIARTQAWANANPDKVKSAHRKYRLEHRDRRRNSSFKNEGAHEHFVAQLEKQKNQCAICHIELIVNVGHAGDPALGCQDHNHENNQLRGALCNRCNKAIGLLDECPKRISEAIRYLEHWKNILITGEEEPWRN